MNRKINYFYVHNIILYGSENQQRKYIHIHTIWVKLKQNIEQSKSQIILLLKSSKLRLKYVSLVYSQVCKSISEMTIKWLQKIIRYKVPSGEEVLWHLSGVYRGLWIST